MDRYGPAINSALAILTALVVSGIILLLVGFNPLQIYLELSTIYCKENYYG